MSYTGDRMERWQRVFFLARQTFIPIIVQDFSHRHHTLNISWPIICPNPPGISFPPPRPRKGKNMSFLSFRQAKRKAKKIITVVHALRPPTPPSAGSCVFPDIVEIGDPSRVSTESYCSSAKLHIDVDITPGPLFPPCDLLTDARESRDQVYHTGPGRVSSQRLHDDVGSVQQKVRVFSFGSAAFVRCWCRVTEDDLSGCWFREVNCG
jgi:hypothetical protein